MSKTIGVSTPHMEGALKNSENIFKENRTVAGLSISGIYLSILKGRND